MTRDEYDDEIIKSETSFVLDEDHEEFMQTNVVPALVKTAAYRLAEEEGMKKPVHPMDTQVGGDHYKTKGLQPLEAVYMNYGLAGLEAAVFTKVNKYFRDKSGIEKKLEDCKKAQHVLQIFQEKLEAEIAKEKFEESYNRNR